MGSQSGSGEEVEIFSGDLGDGEWAGFSGEGDGVDVEGGGGIDVLDGVIIAGSGENDGGVEVGDGDDIALPVEGIAPIWIAAKAGPGVISRACRGRGGGEHGRDRDKNRAWDG